jgi:hypothetical protein
MKKENIYHIVSDSTSMTLRQFKRMAAGVRDLRRSKFPVPASTFAGGGNAVRTAGRTVRYP